MAWRHISDSLPAELMIAIEIARAEQASALESAQPAARHGCEGGDQPNRGGVTIEPVAFVGEGAPTNWNSGKVARPEPRRVEDSVAVKEPTRLAPRVMPIADMSMVTVTAATKGRRPSAPAVIIDMLAWKAQRRHASHPFALATLSASKASPTTVSRPKYTSLLIAQPTQE